MDYCSSCRRYLNGALVCPGCGVYAPSIAEPSDHLRTATVSMPLVGANPGIRGAMEEEAEPASSGDSGFFAFTPSVGGRAARRKRLARLKKHRRRAAAATAVALVGGGLTIASLSGGSSGGHVNAAAPQPGGPVAAPAGATSSSPSGRVAAAPRQSGMAAQESPRTHGGVPVSSAPVAAVQTDTAAVYPVSSSTSRSAAPAGSYRTSAAHSSSAPPQASAPTSRTAAAPSTPSSAPSSASPSGGAASPAAPATPARTTTQPVQVCLLGVCVG